MNKTRRKELVEIQEEIKSFKLDAEALKEKIEKLKDRIEAVRDEEEMAYDNLPESFQEGERGEQMQAAMDAMDNAGSDLDDVINSIEYCVSEMEDSLEYAVNNLQEAIDA